MGANQMLLHSRLAFIPLFREQWMGTRCNAKFVSTSNSISRLPKVVKIQGKSHKGIQQMSFSINVSWTLLSIQSFYCILRASTSTHSFYPLSFWMYSADIPCLRATWHPVKSIIRSQDEVILAVPAKPPPPIPDDLRELLACLSSWKDLVLSPAYTLIFQELGSHRFMMPWWVAINDLFNPTWQLAPNLQTYIFNCIVDADVFSSLCDVQLPNCLVVAQIRVAEPSSPTLSPVPARGYHVVKKRNKETIVYMWSTVEQSKYTYVQYIFAGHLNSCQGPRSMRGRSHSMHMHKSCLSKPHAHSAKPSQIFPDVSLFGFYPIPKN